MDGRDRRANIRGVRDGPGRTLPVQFRSILEARAAVLTGLAFVAGVCGKVGCNPAGRAWCGASFPCNAGRAGVNFYLSRQAGSRMAWAWAYACARSARARKRATGRGEDELVGQTGRKGSNKMSSSRRARQLGDRVSEEICGGKEGGGGGRRSAGSERFVVASQAVEGICEGAAEGIMASGY